RLVLIAPLARLLHTCLRAEDSANRRLRRQTHDLLKSCMRQHCSATGNVREPEAGWIVGWLVRRSALDAKRMKLSLWHFRRVFARSSLHQQRSRTNRVNPLQCQQGMPKVVKHAKKEDQIKGAECFRIQIIDACTERLCR